MAGQACVDMGMSMGIAMGVESRSYTQGCQVSQ